MKEFTRQHLEASTKMPFKNAPRGMSKEYAKRFAKRTKRERKAIAKFYWLRRVNQPNGTRNLHRTQTVVSATEARIRIKNL